MEGNESPFAIGRRELAVGDEQQIVRRPVCGEERGGAASVSAESNRLAAIATVLGREHQPLLRAIEVTLGPSVVRAALQLNDFLGGQVRAVLGFVEIGPVLRELV